MPTELELIALETEFDLYLSFTKRLVLNLPDSDDRTRAAVWLQKLRSSNSDEQKKLRNEHLKLLLFALHRRAILGIFAKPPPDELESFHDGCTLLEMTRELIEITEKNMGGGGDNSGESPLPPVSTNVSADLKEYCATQSIPKFGAHVFYAISNEPIQMWSKSDKCVYPAQSDVPNPLQWELTLSKLTDNVLEKQAEAERLMEEAKKEEENKDEAKDNTQQLPKIDVPVCSPQPPFKWKPDSILTLHQNYDFSDVGVAEDLEEQGKFQLELDEMAFSILDQSLPGRQKVIVRDPYYQGLPPDLAERRHHGVIDEVSDSDGDDSDDEVLQIPPKPPAPPAPFVCPPRPPSPCPPRCPSPPPSPPSCHSNVSEDCEEECGEEDYEEEVGECNCGGESAYYGGGGEEMADEGNWNSGGGELSCQCEGGMQDEEVEDESDYDHNDCCGGA